MKNYFLIALALVSINLATAQDSVMMPRLEQGHWFLEANTNLGAGSGTFGQSGNTSFALCNFNGETLWSLGAEGGYFVIDKLAVKLGLGYADLSGSTTQFTYKLGAKYYLKNRIPLQVDVTGGNQSGNGENPLWLGIQGGYSFFLGKHVSLEPGLRYNISANRDFTKKGIFEANVGFVIHF